MKNMRLEMTATYVFSHATDSQKDGSSYQEEYIDQTSRKIEAFDERFSELYAGGVVAALVAFLDSKGIPGELVLAEAITAIGELSDIEISEELYEVANKITAKQQTPPLGPD